VNDKIASLIKLQDFDSQLDALAQSKARLAPEKENIQSQIQSLASALEEAKKTLTQTQVDRKNLELDVDTKEQAIRKFGNELNSVKSNDAYKALLSQIDEAKKAKSQAEDQVLEMMEKIEKLQRDSKEQDKRFQQDKAAFEKQIADLDAEEQRLQGEWDQKKKERDDYFQTLPDDVRTPYEYRTRGKKRDAVVAPIGVNNTCGGCRTKLPPSVVNDVMKGKDLISCETCSRILYIPAKAPAATA